MFSFPFLLTIYAGFIHAFEADHLLGVGNIVSNRNHIWQAMKDGVFWGLGHSSTIFFIGILMILFKVGISEHSFHYFEATVGLMLITLALYRILKYIRSRQPVAPQQKRFYLVTADERHSHFDTFGHIHTHEHGHSHRLAYGVGLVHGLAGSGALVVLVMAQIKNPFEGLIYLLIFSLGAIAGMLVAAGLFSLPFSKKLIQSPMLQSLLIIITSVLCLLYGGKLIYENLMVL